MKVVIIATEPSGDYLASELIKSLKNKRKKIFISGVGGELMQQNGLLSWVSIKNFNAIGIFEVVIRIFKFIKLMNLVERKIRETDPDIVITVDSPSFSYRIIKRLQDIREKTRFIHYVAPTVWAWKSYRAKIFANLYDKIFTLFKFEPRYFLKHGLDSEFIGHQIFYEKKKILKKKKIISFLPGSRSTEIKNNMKKIKNTIYECQKKIKGFEFFVLTFDHNKELVKSFINNNKVNVITNFNQKQTIMMQSHLAVAASGSVTLELINYKTPMVVFYDTHWLTKIIIKKLVKVKFASIINIFYNKEIIPEFLFENLNSKSIFSAIKNLTYNSASRREQLEHFNNFSKEMLVNGDNPSELFVKKLKI